MDSDDFPSEDNNFREILVNERLYYCDQSLPSKTKLVSYAGKNALEQPKFKLSVTNEGHSDYVTYYAIVELEGKKSRGSGRTKRNAEAAACNKYLNNDYLAVGDYLQLGNPVSAPSHKYPPGAKERSRKKTERFIERKRKEAEEEAALSDVAVSSEGDVVAAQVSEEGAVGGVCVIKPVTAVQPKDGYAFVAYDIERSSGADDSEMLQLAYACENQSDSSYIKPLGSIDRFGSTIHKIVVKSGKLMKGREMLHSVSLNAALEKMIQFLEKYSEEKQVIIICHGNDLQTLINQMTHCGLAEQFKNSFWGAIDFMQVVSDDSEFNEKSKSLTKLNVNKNLSELILKEDITRKELEENSHDAEFDSVLLHRVWMRYLESLTAMDARMLIQNNCMKSSEHMLENAKIYICKIASKRRRKVISGRSKGIVYINGWQC